MTRLSLNARIPAYKNALANGELQTTYQGLVSCVQNLRTDFAKNYHSSYTVANILHGYIDFTYFYLYNDYLKQRKLKYAIVLNHQRVCFELWLLGQTKEVQIEYWEKMRGFKWVNEQVMPDYSIFEVVLLPNPDFDDFRLLSETINRAFSATSQDIFSALDGIN